MVSVHSNTTFSNTSDEEEKLKLKIVSERNWTSRLPYHPELDYSTKTAKDFAQSKIPIFPILGPLFKFGGREVNCDLGEKFNFSMKNLSERAWYYNVTAKFPCWVGHNARLVNRDRKNLNRLGLCRDGRIDTITLDFSIAEKYKGEVDSFSKRTVPIEIIISYMPYKKPFEGNEAFSLLGEHRFIIHVTSRLIRHDFYRCCVYMRTFMPEISNGENMKKYFNLLLENRKKGEKKNVYCI
jgi:hypothetical protein